MTEVVLPIGVVAVSYDPGETLSAMLDSLHGATGRPYSVVLSDNGSQDGSIEQAAARAEVTVLRNGSNLGYGGAMNSGVAALPPQADPVVLINTDVVFADGALDILVAALERLPDAGAVGPLIVTDDGHLYPSARRLPTIGGGLGHGLFGWWWPTNPWTRAYRLDHATPTERAAGWLSGSCLVMRRSAFDAVGGFDPGYFMYFEDVDLGDRLARAGWASIYVPTATVTHVGGHSTSRHKAAMIRAHHASAYRYLAGRYHHWWQAPLRLVLRGGLALRQALATHSRKVADGARLPDVGQTGTSAGS